MGSVSELFLSINKTPLYESKILDGSDGFDDFKKKTPLIGTRITLENELKISNTEALNYLMGFPLNFKLESLVKMLPDDVKFSPYMSYKEVLKHINSLKLNFDDKNKRIERNFESTTHIDIQEFLAWAESNDFIIKKPQ